jgi:hypothetical protein
MPTLSEAKVRNLFFSTIFCLMLCATNAVAQQFTSGRATSDRSDKDNTKRIPGQLAEQMAQRLSEQLPKRLSQLAVKKMLGVPVTEQQSPQPTSTGTDDRPVLKEPEERPLGAAGKSKDRRKPVPEDADFRVIQDRWRVGIPEDPRFTNGNIFNPYRQNVLKGDYPIIGNNIFMNFDLALEGVFKVAQLPVGQAVSSNLPNSFEFFGRGRQDSIDGIMMFSFDMFKGDASFKPVDWRFKVTGLGNFNFDNARENQVINADVRERISRQKNFVAAENVFVEYRLGDTTKIFPFLRGRGSKGGRSPEFDTTSIRLGVQQFTSDFRGFIFSDSNLGARLFGNIGSNRWQYNMVYFNMLEKDTNSKLNALTFNDTDFRNQNVYIANLFRQDTFVLGYTTQFSLHYNDDRPSFKLDNNGFQVRPAPVGFINAQHRVRAGYFGWTGDGHFGRYNITHALYQAIGSDTGNPLAQSPTNLIGFQRINAQMAAAEFSIDYDYIRYRIAAFYASGDANPKDNRANGFDAILDAPNFAGGKFSFFNSEALRLLPTGLAIKDERSLLPSLRTSKIQGQANFVNPGLTLYNLGVDVDVTPKLRGFFNYNYLRFNETAVLTDQLNRGAALSRDFGHDLGVGFIYRPLLNENFVLTGGASTLLGSKGFKNIFTSNCDGTNLGQGCGASQPTLFSTFLTARFVY